MSKENYTNHNFVTNYAYEIYREDGTLRAKYEPEAKADCEGTFEVDIKDKEGNLKSHEEKPIRSFQVGLIGRGSWSSMHSYFPSMAFNGVINDSCRILNHTGSASGFGGGEAQYTGIFFANKSGSSPDFSWARVYYMQNVVNGGSFTIVDVAPYKDGQVVKFSISKTATVDAASISSPTGVGLSSESTSITTATSQWAMICFDTFAETKSCSLNDVVKITYNFAFPTSDNSTITKNLIVDLFANILRNEKLKNSNGLEIATVKQTTKTNSKLGLVHVPYINAAVNNNAAGLVLGTSNNSVDWEDYCLNNVCNTNELQPQQSTNTDFTAGMKSGNTVYCMYARNFKNISDHDITIREAGVYSYATDTTYTVAQAGSFLLAHWLTGDVVVHPGETIRVYWKPTIIVS